MPITTPSSLLNLPNEPLLFDLDTLYERLRQVKDQRHRRGVRYPLAEILLIGVLAKLAGQTSSRGLADWANLRRGEMQRLFALRRATMPHFSTWSRILGRAVDPEELERVLGQFFGSHLAPVAHPGQRHLCLDGKTLRMHHSARKESRSASACGLSATGGSRLGAGASEYVGE